jgi:hypothetical protein
VQRTQINVTRALAPPTGFAASHAPIDADVIVVVVVDKRSTSLSVLFAPKPPTT